MKQKKFDFFKLLIKYMGNDTVVSKNIISTQADGKDGYDCLAHARRLVDDENGPTLTYALQNHFRAIAMREGRTRKSSVHHQSLVTMSRK